jgi:hypothetical protein
MHEFVFLIDGKQVTVNSWDDIPERFDHVIKFLPDCPEPPHTEEQHREIELWPARLQQLMEIERNASNN